MRLLAREACCVRGSTSALTCLRGRSRARSRLARKAESARQARLRHKQFVTDLQDQAAGLHARIRELEAHCTSGPGSAAVAMRELKSALTPDQQNTLVNWCAALLRHLPAGHRLARTTSSH